MRRYFPGQSTLWHKTWYLEPSFSRSYWIYCSFCLFRDQNIWCAKSLSIRFAKFSISVRSVFVFKGIQMAHQNIPLSGYELYGLSLDWWPVVWFTPSRLNCKDLPIPCIFLRHCYEQNLHFLWCFWAFCRVSVARDRHLFQRILDLEEETSEILVIEILRTYKSTQLLLKLRTGYCKPNRYHSIYKSTSSQFTWLVFHLGHQKEVSWPLLLQYRSFWFIQ